MNIFETLAKDIRDRIEAGLVKSFDIGKPVQTSGLWTLSIVGNDGYLLELGWQRNRGFGISAGYDHDFGDGFDEIFIDSHAVLTRALDLFESKLGSRSDAPLTLSELRKLVGVLQNDLAATLGMTKGGLAQLEKAGALERMQIGTVEKLIQGLGGKLVLTAKLPGGEIRELVH